MSDQMNEQKLTEKDIREMLAYKPTSPQTQRAQELVTALLTETTVEVAARLKDSGEKIRFLQVMQTAVYAARATIYQHGPVILKSVGH